MIKWIWLLCYPLIFFPFYLIFESVYHITQIESKNWTSASFWAREKTLRTIFHFLWLTLKLVDRLILEIKKTLRTIFQQNKSKINEVLLSRGRWQLTGHHYCWDHTTKKITLGLELVDKIGWTMNNNIILGLQDGHQGTQGDILLGSMLGDKTG